MPDNLKMEAHRGDPFAAAVRATRMPMIITDPRQHDNPIVFVNDAFLKLTGYTRLDVTGRNCRFLQGPETDPAAVDRLRDAIRQQADIRVDLVNYRKDGSTFHNALYVGPVRDAAGTVVYYFASQIDVSERYALTAEIERLKGELAEARARLDGR
ncbi:PAS domain-containing protein [Methylobacterium sp. J-026]|uniref:PAS domain-containing protein n=1 Tax=Methylobacterium sp. J-026 TaxID=2836624 RepID=UPI003919174B